MLGSRRSAAARTSPLVLAALALPGCAQAVGEPAPPPSGTAAHAAVQQPGVPPTAPSGLEVEVVGDSLLARWGPPEDEGSAPVTAYRVFPGTREPVLLPVGHPQHLMGGVQRDELLLVQVAAVSEAGQGPVAVVHATRPAPAAGRTTGGAVLLTARTGVRTSA